MLGSESGFFIDRRSSNRSGLGTVGAKSFWTQRFGRTALHVGPQYNDAAGFPAGRNEEYERASLQLRIASLTKV
jgi:hypothetical protein